MLVDAIPGNWVDPATVLTFTGATTAVIAINVVARKVFRVNHPGVPFAAAVVLAFLLAGSQGMLRTAIGWMIAIVNACILFCASIGANEVAADVGKEKPAGKGEQQGHLPKAPVPAFASFFRSPEAQK